MKKLFVFILFLLCLVAFSLPAFAAINPIQPPNAPASPPPGIAPASYLAAVKLQQDNKFNENDLKSFLHQFFAIQDRHAEVGQLLLLISDDNDLQMQLPGATVTSQKEFDKWYRGIGATYISNLYTPEKIDIKILGKGQYSAEAVILWQALSKDGKYSSSRQRYVFAISDGSGYWPRINTLTVTEIK